MIGKRRFGRTELRVPALTFGGGWVGGILIHQEQETAFAALDRATSAGMDWIDTASGYGNGVSESVIGAWLRERPDAQVSGISTKFRIDPDAPDPAGQMMRSVTDSLLRLGRDRVDVIFLHNQIVSDRGLPVSDAMAMAETMARLRDERLCDHIGMTALGAPDSVAEVAAAGVFDVAQVYYNALNPTADRPAPPGWNTDDFSGLLHICAGQDMGVMGIRIFAGGHLASAQRHGREIPITVNTGAEIEDARAAALAEAVGAGQGSPAQVALRFGLASPLLSTVVVGMAEPDHLEQALAANDMGPLPADVLTSIADRHRSAPFVD